MDNKNLIIIILNVLIFIFLFGAIYFLLMYIKRQRQGIGIRLEKLYTEINDMAINRKEEEKRIKRLYGNIRKENFISNLDEKLRYSGIFRKYPFLTTEIFIVFTILITLAVSFLGILVTGKWYIFLVVAIIMWFMVMVVLSKLCDIRYKSTANQMIPFINMIAGNALASDDLMYILKTTAENLDEPLRGAVFGACDMAERTGDITAALKNLEEDIEYPFFKTVIRNLEIASRTLTDYSKIIEECREMIQTMLEHERELHDIYDSERASMLITVFAGFVCIIFLSAGLFGMSLTELMVMMGNNVIGSALLVYALLSLMLGLYYAFMGGRN